MAWMKASPETIARYHSALPDDPRVQRKQMFGYPCGFVGGNMFSGVHEHRIIARLAEADRAELLAVPGAEVFTPMEGRPMREYVVVPEPIAADNDALKGWLQRAFDHAAILPPKEKAAPRRKAR